VPRAPRKGIGSSGKGATRLALCSGDAVADLVDVAPVAAPELTVIKTYLGNLIDQWLAAAKASGSTAKATDSFNEGTRPEHAALDRE
jgi:hypothetical protein